MSRESQFERDGFQLIPDLLSADACDKVAAELTVILDGQRQSGSKPRGGLRNILRSSPATATFASSARIISLIGNWLGGPAFPVRAILFDKIDGANWGVPWHQDLAIAVAEKIETPGFNPWSVKDGVVHVNPPVPVLAGMATLRLHLDDCFADNGPLRVLPGSHLHGELSSEAISDWAVKQASVTCEMPKGGALLMRPLLLHASSAARACT